MVTGGPGALIAPRPSDAGELAAEPWLAEPAGGPGGDPAGRLLAIFDGFDAWFQRPDFAGRLMCLERLRAEVERLAAEAGVADPEGLARQWHILLRGSIVAAGEGDRQAARRAREAGALVLAGAEIRTTPFGG